MSGDREPCEPYKMNSFVVLFVVFSLFVLVVVVSLLLLLLLLYFVFVLSSDEEADKEEALLVALVENDDEMFVRRLRRLCLWDSKSSSSVSAFNIIIFAVEIVVVWKIARVLLALSSKPLFLEGVEVFLFFLLLFIVVIVETTEDDDDDDDDDAITIAFPSFWEREKKMKQKRQLKHTEIPHYTLYRIKCRRRMYFFHIERFLSHVPKTSEEEEGNEEDFCLPLLFRLRRAAREKARAARQRN